MTDINSGPLTKACYELCGLIEKLPASLDQTAAITAASDLMRAIAAREIGWTHLMKKWADSDKAFESQLAEAQRERDEAKHAQYASNRKAQNQAPRKKRGLCRRCWTRLDIADRLDAGRSCFSFIPI